MAHVITIGMQVDERMHEATAEINRLRDESRRAAEVNEQQALEIAELRYNLDEVTTARNESVQREAECASCRATATARAQRDTARNEVADLKRQLETMQVFREKDRARIADLEGCLSTIVADRDLVLRQRQDLEKQLAEVREERLNRLEDRYAKGASDARAGFTAELKKLMAMWVP